MNGSFVWKDGEEEGSFSYRRLGKELLRLTVFRMDEDEVEIGLDYLEQDWKQAALMDNIDKKIISKMTSAICDLQDILQKKGIQACSFVTERGSAFQKLLDSTHVVSMDYSEFMLKKIVTGEEETEGTMRLYFISDDAGSTCNGYLEDEEEPVAVCQILPFEDGCYVYEVAVARELRGKGIGTSFLKELMKELPKHWSSDTILDLEQGESSAGVVVRLQVGSYNGPALHIYRKLGFETETELCYYR